MTPYLGTIAGYPIPTFAVLLDAGVLLGVLHTVWLMSRRGHAPDRVLDVLALELIAALAGSRIWYVKSHWSEYALAPTSVLSVWEGGLSLPGALLATAAAHIPLCRWLKVNAASLGDAACVGVALALSVGRLGCLGAGCGAGLTATGLPSWMPRLPLPDAVGVIADRFPSPLVESVSDALLCMALIVAWRARLAPFTVVAIFATGHGLTRLAIESLRADSTFIGQIALASIWAALMACTGLAVLATRPWRARPGLDQPQ